LDWEPIQKWLNYTDNLIALAWDDNNDLCGVMAFAPPHQTTSWMRLLALPSTQRQTIFDALWQTLYPELNQKVSLLGVLINNYWMNSLLEKVGFEHTDTVVSLARRSTPLPYFHTPSVRIRGLRFGEFPRVLAVDHAAFGALWQMRASELREAGRRACHYTLAHDGNQIVGYQLTMQYERSMHLARIATLPTMQGNRIGSQLLYDTLRYAERKQIPIVTVNTQSSNLVSQHLYRRFGFEYDSPDLPVYTLRFNPENPSMLH
jgi:GNAT superfamily N-acetyltransferase